MAKIVLISDTHGLHRNLRLPHGEILVHAGDWTADSSKQSIVDFLDWLNQLPYEHKIFIAGNHETWVEQNENDFADLLKLYPTLTYLKDSGVTINGIKFWGAPWTPRFFDWAYNKDRGQHIKECWDKIPDDTNVLVTHGPPRGILDETSFGKRENVGCDDLVEALQKRLANVWLHVFGHVHGPGGNWIVKGNVAFANASVVNERYMLKNQPIVIDCNEWIY